MVHTLSIEFAPNSSAKIPSLFRIPFAFGARCSAAPVSVARRDCSKICTSWPCLRRARPAVRPPMPPPTIRTLRGCGVLVVILLMLIGTAVVGR